MGQLNLRGIDDELIREVKATAASEGMTIPQLVSSILERDRRRGGWTAARKEPEAEKPKATPKAESATAPEKPKPRPEEWNQATVYQKPPHAKNCTCYSCKPRK